MTGFDAGSPATGPIHVDLARMLADSDVRHAEQWLADRAPHEIADEITRLKPVPAALAWRLLPKGRALDVFEELDSTQQQAILEGLRDHAFAELLEEMDPDDRARLLGEAPAGFVRRVLAGLSTGERAMTAQLLGYPADSVGRYMSPEVVVVPVDATVGQALARIRERAADSETIDIVALVDGSRQYRGTVDLKHIVLAAEGDPIVSLARDDYPTIRVADEAEAAARLIQETNLLALVVVDSEERVVGVLTIDDALEVIEQADSEDIARQAAVLPSGGHYFSSSVWRLARLRVVWLLVLIFAAALTVSVLQFFESSLEQVTALALFIPLLVGTGGNVGAQAATAAVRAIALGEVRTGDLMRVAWREARVGLLLGVTLGIIALGVGSLVVGPPVAITVGLSVIAVCIWAATVGGLMPILARAMRIDPAVISAPLVTTLVDATGLVIYFLIAGAVLGL